MTSITKPPARRAGLLLALLLVAGMGAGCTNRSGEKSSSGGTGVTTGKVGVAAPNADVAASKAAPVATDPTRSVVRTASVDVRTADVDNAADAVTRLATTNGGRVESDQRSDNDRSRTATLVIRVLPDRLEQVVTAVGALGHETNRQIQDEDVTTTQADVTARVAALTTSVHRLRQLLSRSGTVSDLVLLEKTLSDREADLEAMQAREASISQQVALASLTVNLSAPAAVLPAAKAGGIHPTGFFAAIGSGFHAVVIGLGLLLAGIGYLLPAAVPLALAALAFLAWRRRRTTTPPARTADGSA